MSFTKGFFVIGSFSLTWGVLAGINLALLRLVSGLALDVSMLGLSSALGLMQALVIICLLDRYILRHSPNLRQSEPPLVHEAPGNSIRAISSGTSGKLPGT
jgi:hypothetical protein